MSLPLTQLSPCAYDGFSSAKLRSYIPPDAAIPVDVPMTYDAATTTVSGHLASQPAGTSVGYKVAVTLADGTTATFPRNGYYLLIVETDSNLDAGVDGVGDAATDVVGLDGARADAVADEGAPMDAGTDAAEDAVSSPLDAAGDVPASGDASPSSDARADAAASDGRGASPKSSGCGCAVASASQEPFAALLLTLAVAALVSRRRRRAHARR